MKSTAEASSGLSRQMFQISPVVTGTSTAFNLLDKADQLLDVALRLRLRAVVSVAQARPALDPAAGAAEITSLPTKMR